MMHRIQTPTLGRVVLCAPDPLDGLVRARAHQGVLAHGQHIFPATVVAHLGAGRVGLAVAGFDGFFVADHGEVEPGVPPVGRWCYPPMVREETVVEAYEPHRPFVEHVSEDGGIISDQGAAALNSPAK